MTSSDKIFDVPAVHSFVRRVTNLSPEGDLTSDDFVPLFAELATLLSTFPSTEDDASSPTISHRSLEASAREATPLVLLLSNWSSEPVLIAMLSSACARNTIDPYLAASAFFEAVRVKKVLGQAADMIGAVARGFGMFDVQNQWRAWILTQRPPEVPGEDVDNVLGRAIARGTQLDARRASALAAIGRLAQALSMAMYDSGNVRQALHVHLCSISIYERVRGCVAVPKDARVGEQELRDLYAAAAEEAMRLEESDLAVELGTKLVTIHEVAIAEAVMETRDEATSVVPHGHVDPLGHFKAQELLGRALGRFGDADGSFNAHRRALELLEVEWPWEEEMQSAKFTAPPEIKRAIYKNMMSCSHKLQHPLEETLSYARQCVGVIKQLDAANPDSIADPDDALVLLHAGRLVYSYALEFAGGVESAASPPVAVLHLKKEGVPEIKVLLDEAAGYLEDALARADVVEKEGGKRTVALQLAIVDVERRREDACRSLLGMFHIGRDTLAELDTARKSRAQPPPTTGTLSRTRRGSSMPPQQPPQSVVPFLDTVYSPQSFQRLLPLSIDARASSQTPSPSRSGPSTGSIGSYFSSKTSTPTTISPSLPHNTPTPTSAANVFSFVTLTRRLTLSRRSSVKIQCASCCMMTGGEGVVKCEPGCGGVFCDEECLGVHAGGCSARVGSMGGGHTRSRSVGGLWA
ncbi:hypothetical protein HDV00_005785 [Rhizophlyctis rosea]|nr:hypothetical protein HDV00_005785 [Rhizophlyctis rosea]